MRINKFISHNTKYSRREADKLIEQGLVNVGVKPILQHSYVVGDDDKIFINGNIIKKKSEYSIIVYNKPKGELVTKKDDRGRKTIYHSLNSRFKAYTYVGRLDFSSEGLLILTDNVNVAHMLSNSDIKRGYKVKIKGDISGDIIKAMDEGIYLDDALKGAYEGSKIKSMRIEPFPYEIKKNSKSYSIIKMYLKGGKNREIRRFFSSFNKNVVDLKRFSFGDINLNALPSGKSRFLTSDEYKYVRSLMNREIDKNDKVKDRYRA